MLETSIEGRDKAFRGDGLATHIPGGGQDRVLRVTNFEIRVPFSPQA